MRRAVTDNCYYVLTVMARALSPTVRTLLLCQDAALPHQKSETVSCCLYNAFIWRWLTGQIPVQSFFFSQSSTSSLITSEMDIPFLAQATLKR